MVERGGEERSGEAEGVVSEIVYSALILQTNSHSTQTPPDSHDADSIIDLQGAVPQQS